ncbi:MAG: 50S ribosomal protein L28 [Candidatus Peregrinibacteria bacterium GW2011_GWC2_33_13]|nr:MAG: 50S ribosomal protein L28 [Candidatus Peregrinibacteria bacterium GW2011_GWC2_33_13]
MSNRCQFCLKKTQVGMNISHSHRRTKRTFKPNLFVKKLHDPQTGIIYKVKLCSKCLKTYAKHAN